MSAGRETESTQGIFSPVGPSLERANSVNESSGRRARFHRRNDYLGTIKYSGEKVTDSEVAELFGIPLSGLKQVETEEIEDGRVVGFTVRGAEIRLYDLQPKDWKPYTHDRRFPNLPVFTRKVIATQRKPQVWSRN